MRNKLRLGYKKLKKKSSNSNYSRKDRDNINKINPPVCLLSDFFIPNRKLTKQEIKTILDIRNNGERTGKKLMKVFIISFCFAVIGTLMMVLISKIGGGVII